MMPRKRWVRGDDPAEMLRFLHTTLTAHGTKPRRARKPMLYVAALCRQHWHEMPWAYRVLVDLVERKAEGESFAQLQPIRQYAHWLCHVSRARVQPAIGYPVPDYSRVEADFTHLGYTKPPVADDHLLAIGPERVHDLSHLLLALDCERAVSYHPRKEPHSVPLLHDVGGDPYRPVKFDPRWRTDTAVAVARQMYESREFFAMPILADALQDAGCENADVLNHCRDPKQPHARGCWVVDLVLGKE
jgi:hypothetical protein